MQALSTNNRVATLAAVEALGQSQGPDAEPDSVQLALNLLTGDLLRSTTESAAAQGLAAVSLGPAVDWAIVLGLAGGADLIWKFEGNALAVRPWGVGEVGIDTIMQPTFWPAVGISLGFWQTVYIPEAFGWINGLIVDLPNQKFPNVGIRFMTVDKRSDFLKGDRIGYTVQVFYGRGAGLARYGGFQGIFPLKPFRASLTVINTATQSPVVAANVSNELQCTLTNTSGAGIGIHTDDKLLVTMPTYFSQAEKNAMLLVPPNADWSASAGTLNLQYLGSNMTWGYRRKPCAGVFYHGCSDDEQLGNQEAEPAHGINPQGHRAGRLCGPRRRCRRRPVSRRSRSLPVPSSIGRRPFPASPLSKVIQPWERTFRRSCRQMHRRLKC